MGNDHWKNQPRVPAGNSNGGQFLSPNSYRQNTPYSEITRHQNADYIVYLEDRKPTVIDPADKLTEDEYFPRSIGAMWANHKIKMPDGTNARFVEGAKLERKEIIGGYRCARKIDDIQSLCRRYPETASTSRFWAKVKGVSDIILEDSTIIKAEVHWYEHPKTGKVDFKYKEDVDES